MVRFTGLRRCHNYALFHERLKRRIAEACAARSYPDKPNGVRLYEKRGVKGAKRMD